MTNPANSSHLGDGDRYQRSEDRVRQKLSSVLNTIVRELDSKQLISLLLGTPGSVPSIIAQRLSLAFTIELTQQNVVGAKSFDDLASIVTSRLPASIDILKRESLPKCPAPAPSKIQSNKDITVDSQIGPYRVLRFLGRGGIAKVYLAEHNDGRKVAIKVGESTGGGRGVTRLLEVTDRRSHEGISPDEVPAEIIYYRPEPSIDLANEKEVDRLLRAENIKLCEAVSGSVVRVLDELEINDRPALVLEYIQGKTMRQKIRSTESLHVNTLLNLAEACRDIEGHGDLKPENILIKPSNHAVLIDPAVSINDRTIRTATPHYNPFLAEGTRADVYSIGIILYEVLTGTLPFDEVPWEFAGRKNQGGCTVQLSASHFLSYAPPQMLNPKTPEELTQIIYHSLTCPEYEIQDLIKELKLFLQGK